MPIQLRYRQVRAGMAGIKTNCGEQASLGLGGPLPVADRISGLEGQCSSELEMRALRGIAQHCGRSPIFEAAVVVR
jgi:hypothetical protein